MDAFTRREFLHTAGALGLSAALGTSAVIAAGGTPNLIEGRSATIAVQRIPGGRYVACHHVPSGPLAGVVRKYG